MRQRDVVIGGDEGLHLRPAGRLSEKALSFSCTCSMVIGSKTYNLKSVLSVLSAQVNAGRQVRLVCEGEDEEEAIEALSALLAEDTGGSGAPQDMYT